MKLRACCDALADLVAPVIDPGVRSDRAVLRGRLPDVQCLADLVAQVIDR